MLDSIFAIRDETCALEDLASKMHYKVGRHGRSFAIDGMKTTSVSSATNMLVGKFNFQRWLSIEMKKNEEKDDEPDREALGGELQAYAKRRREEGTHIHRCFEKLITKQDLTEKETATVTKYSRAFWQMFNILQQFDLNIVATEGVVGSKNNGVAGRFDLLCKCRGTRKYVLIDLKTKNFDSAQHWEEYRMGSDLSTSKPHHSIDHLPRGDLTRASIQLQLYQDMIFEQTTISVCQSYVMLFDCGSGTVGLFKTRDVARPVRQLERRLQESWLEQMVSDAASKLVSQCL